MNTAKKRPLNGVAPKSDRAEWPERDSPSARAKKRVSMVQDPVLGPRRVEVTHWRCRRVDEGGGKGSLLMWNDGGPADSNEWPIDTFSPELLRDRWGAGRYIVQYIREDNGFRRPWGRSRIVSISPPPAAGPTTTEETKTATPTPGMPPVPPAGEANFSSVFSLLAYLEDRNDRNRSAAAADARFAIERAAAEAKAAQDRAAAEIKAAQDRYRADLEFQLERERLASKERIAQIEAQSRAPAPRGEKIDQEALALRIRDLVDESVRTALDDAEDEDDGPAPAAPMDQGTALIIALKDMLAPVLPTIVASLAPKLPPSGGDGTGNDGSGNVPPGGAGQ